MSDYAVVNPATGETLATYPTATDAEIAEAVTAADAAYRTWARATTPAERADLVRKVAELHRERRDTLAAIVVREMGKPLSHAEGEVDFAADIIEYYADNFEAITADAPFEILGEGTALIRRSPIGPLLGIMPWNFPYYQVARFAAPNLVVGNTIILKHAPQCPESSAAMAQMFLDAGFPERCVRQRVRHQRPGCGDHRRPAGCRRFGDGLGASRCGRCRACRRKPQEGRARDGRLGPVHPAVHR